MIAPSQQGMNQQMPTDLKGACRALEQQFFQMMLSTMRKAMVPSESKGSIGLSKDTSMAMMDAEMARIASQGEGQGLWKQLYEQLSPQGVKSDTSDAEENQGVSARSMPYILR